MGRGDGMGGGEVGISSVWPGRRVFLTGHTGFKGSWLAVWLAKMGAQVRGYALDPCTEPNLFTVAEVGTVLEDVRGNILDRVRLEASMTEFAPEVVFHLAAQPLVRQSYNDPIETYATNVMGTAHVLEAIRKTASVRAVVCVTTDKCYENREWVWPYRENDPLGGHDPYSSSKACAEIVSAAYRSSFFGAKAEHQVGIATARAGNVIGGGDWSADRLLPDLIRGFLSGDAAVIRRPRAVRPWQHVLEPLHGYILLAEGLLQGRAELGSAFNFGPEEGDAWAVERIADRVADKWGGSARWTLSGEAGALDAGYHEAANLRLDSSRARAALRWQPRLGIEEALDWTVEWYRAALYGEASASREASGLESMRAFTVGQIEAYEKAGGRRSSLP